MDKQNVTAAQEQLVTSELSSGSAKPAPAAAYTICGAVSPTGVLCKTAPLHAGAHSWAAAAPRLDYSGNGRVSVAVGDIIKSPKVQRQVASVKEIEAAAAYHQSDGICAEDHDKALRLEAELAGMGIAADICKSFSLDPVPEKRIRAEIVRRRAK